MYMYNIIIMDFDYNRDKNEWLKENRKISFEDAIDSINSKRHLLGDVKHFNQTRYPNQRIFIIKIKRYVYLVPYVLDLKRNVKFLKTIYANRKLKKLYENKQK